MGFSGHKISQVCAADHPQPHVMKSDHHTPPGLDLPTIGHHTEYSSVSMEYILVTQICRLTEEQR